MNDQGERMDDRRRRFLKGAALGAVAAGTVGAPVQSQAAQAAEGQAEAPTRNVPRPNEARESLPPPEDPVTQVNSGGDFMTDAIRSLNFDYVITNPASSFRGLHESLVNYGGNKAPELLTVTHEEIGVAMAHGYAKIADKPLAVMVHGTVGVQHASMALYNAYCDRVPIVLLGGNTLEAEMRQRAEWVHSAQDPAAMVRDFLKWDDQPVSLQGFSESLTRAYQISMTPPYGPVMLSVDTDLQEEPIHGSPKLTRLPRVVYPQADSNALTELAQMLVKAQNPVVIAGRVARNQAGMDALVAFAETLNLPVIDQGARTNFPSHHPLNQGFRGRQLLNQADVILALEVNELYAALNTGIDRIKRRNVRGYKEGAKVVHLGAKDLFIKSNFQDFGRYQEIDLSITGDAQTSLPYLTEAVKRAMGAARPDDAKRAKFAEARDEMLRRTRIEASIGWDNSPITTARLTMELWEQIKTEDWSLVGEGLMTGWNRLWPSDKVYQFNGGSGGWGLGYFAPAALGAALANRDKGRISVTFQGDGDLMFVPGVLWTAAHHKIPILYLMFNNRAYHQEVMYVQRMAGRLSRGAKNAHIGTTLTNPNIDFAMLAKSMGVYAEGPITNPRDLGPAIKRALAVVKRGEPALVDVVCEPR
jgi:acetolactate synthase-1/2/3 large subunit